MTAPPAHPPPHFRTADEWLRSLGNVPLHRIVFNPLPGTATLQDVVRLVNGNENRVELVNKTLVEKPVGLRESIIAGILITLLNNVVRPRRLGVVSGESGMVRMLAGNVRMPDVAFFRREDMPGGELPAEPAPLLSPALAVEVLSQSNTEDEMRIKVEEYFQAGVRAVWLLDPDTRSVRVYGAPENFRRLDSSDTLQGGEVLPEFTVAVHVLFEI